MLTRTAVAALLALVAPACLVMSSEKTEVEGTRVSEETLAQIGPGASEDLVTALLGEPTTREDLSDGTSLLKWHYKKTTRKGGAVLILFASSKKTEESGTIYVILEDGKVKRVWRD